jgi:hypothetical protein
MREEIGQGGYFSRVIYCHGRAEEWYNVGKRVRSRQ